MTLHIGVIGASSEGGWARYAHMPALAAVPGIEVAAVMTSNRESAARSAAAFGVPHGVASLDGLLALDLDLVAVSVKAPEHAGAALAVLDAGKHLFVEWPMGANLGQAQAIERRARERGKRGFIGLQARMAPEVRHAASLIADGYLGRLTSISIDAAFPFWREPVSAGYSAQVENGAHLLAIPGGHGLDLMRLLAGDVRSLNARVRRTRDSVMATDAGRAVPMTAPEQFSVIGALENDALLSAHYDGTSLTPGSFRMALAGEDGELLLEADGMPEIAPFRLSGTRQAGGSLDAIACPAPDIGSDAPRAGPAYNTYFMWRQIARDLADGTESAPSLATGLETRKLLDAIATSAASNGKTIDV
ncbi:MAG: Gfo/Idh/MocA family oxidoreductase [Novosphingobium sp.]|nr:Gfo/Idh/MocA family oxidoreductase [Novosphingobium sp.]